MTEEIGGRPVFELECPCCGARIAVDAEKGVILESHERVDPRKGADLKDAQQLLKEESERIHDRYRRIVAADKTRGAEMDKKFKEFFEKAKDEPAPKPVRDIDLD
ncbi:MAG: hypothetical protein AB1346_13400 [Thermodesulfobacteriota bacterium]